MLGCGRAAVTQVQGQRGRTKPEHGVLPLALAYVQAPAPHAPLPGPPPPPPCTNPAQHHSKSCVCVPAPNLVPYLQSAANTKASVGALATAGAGSAGGGASAIASSTHTPYPEPDPLTCCVVDCGAEFDTKGRQPVAAACVCANLTCKKCGEVAASLPSPCPCGLCGRAALAPPDSGDCQVDVGVLVTVHRAARVTDR